MPLAFGAHRQESIRRRSRNAEGRGIMPTALRRPPLPDSCFGDYGIIVNTAAAFAVKSLSPIMITATPITHVTKVT